MIVATHLQGKQHWRFPLAIVSYVCLSEKYSTSDSLFKSIQGNRGSWKWSIILMENMTQMLDPLKVSLKYANVTFLTWFLTLKYMASQGQVFSHQTTWLLFVGLLPTHDSPKGKLFPNPDRFIDHIVPEYGLKNRSDTPFHFQNFSIGPRIGPQLWVQLEGRWVIALCPKNLLVLAYWQLDLLSSLQGLGILLHEGHKGCRNCRIRHATRIHISLYVFSNKFQALCKIFLQWLSTFGLFCVRIGKLRPTLNYLLP